MAGSFGTVAFGSVAAASSGGGGSLPVGPGGTWSLDEAELFVEIDFSQAVEGVGVGADSPIALWDVGEWDTDLWEGGTIWTDVTGWCQAITTKAEFSRELVAYNAGRLTVTLDNADGSFSPDNPDSPYRIGDSTSIGVLRPIRVRGTYAGTEFVLFTGRIETWDENPTGLEGAVVEVTAVDPFAELAAFDSYAQTPAGAGDTFGDRIARILDNAGWTGGSRIDTGVHTMQATTLAANAVTELKLTADSEGGAVWVGADGILYADGQGALQEKQRSTVPQVVFTNVDQDPSADPVVGYETTDIVISYDGSQVVNIAAFARAGGTVQVAASSPSRVLYGDRQTERSDLVCETDPQALTLAERQVALYQAPERRVESLKFSPLLQPSELHKVRAWQAIAYGGLGLRSLVKLEHTTSSGYDITKYLYVRGISHTITPTNWVTSVSFSSASVMYSLVDSDWDLGVWDTAGWAF